MLTTAPLDLDRDYPEIDRLFLAEQWPFLRSDLEVSHAQPGAVALVARRAGAFAGFFATHPFAGRVAYLDMMIVAPGFRKAGACRALYVATMAALRRAGLRACVVHTTNDSAPLIRFLGFRAGARFTLLRREPAGAPQPLARAVRLGAGRQAELVALDAAAFGCARPEWIGALLAQPDTPLLGLERDGALCAALALRPRREGACSIDTACAASEADLLSLVDETLDAYADRRLECFVRTDGPLDPHLRARGFEVPDFFRAIGPLVEWRKGATAGIGDSPHLQTLSWF